ncbi:MAG: hypothetical protein LBK23_01115 [Oscillospiraceae bacterium]|jgi:hypothetical protein|nr:hypothetical protein [Oscillospiraceae bacterium]
MKRFFSVIISTAIAVSMLFTMVASAAAADGTPDDTAGIAVVIGNDELSQKDYPLDTEFDDIRKSDDGYYAMAVSTSAGEKYIPVGRLDIDLVNPDNVNTALSRTDIKPEIKEAIQESSALAIESGVGSRVVTLFSQALLPKIDLLSNARKPTAVATLARKSRATKITPYAPEYTYITYSGVPMVSERLYYTSVDSNLFTLKTGVTTKDVMATLSTMVVEVAGSFVPTLVSIVTSGFADLYAMYTNANPSAVGNTKDKAEARITFDEIKQWTYVNPPNAAWILGLYSEKLTVTAVYHYQYYWYPSTLTGRSESNTKSTSSVYETPNFSTSFATALARLQGGQAALEERVTKFKIGTVTCNITF